MRFLLILSVVLWLSISPESLGQSLEQQDIEVKVENEIYTLKAMLVNDLKGLATELEKVSEPLARAYAQAYIAAAVWDLDNDWAKVLLQDAYEITLPDKTERRKLREQPIGASPPEPKNNSDIARFGIRQMILKIAGRDPAFADQLVQIGKQELGKIEEVNLYSSLARNAIGGNNIEAAEDYLLRAIEADPTQIGVGLGIYEVATKDREAADRLIMRYIDRLRAIPLTQSSATRTYFSLEYVIFPYPYLNEQKRQLPPAGPHVVRAYVEYAIESLTAMEQREPGSAAKFRGFLMSIWQPLQQHAPDLAGRFMMLEQISRFPGAAPLPTVSNLERHEVAHREKVEYALKTRKPEDLAREIKNASFRGDFAEARKMLNLLPEGSLHTQCAEEVNWREAASLTAKGEIAQAEQVARRLMEADSILRVYPSLIKACVNKNDYLAISLVTDAVQRIKKTGDRSKSLRLLSTLAHSIAPLDQWLSLNLLDDLVDEANRTNLDSSYGSV